ncbi:MAG: DUF5684 domain-containing protein [Prochloraceae cyanobacterium]
MFINRDAESQLDYTHLSQTICTAITELNLPNIEYLSLYSRVMGEVEPDWETSLKISTKAAIRPKTDSDSTHLNLIKRDSEEVSAQPSSTCNSTESGSESVGSTTPQSQKPETPAESSETLPPIDLSQFCFVRNKLLLTSQLTAPPEKIVQTILFFHDLSDREKQIVLPTLEKIFKAPDSVEIEGFSEDTQKWLQSIASNNSENFRKAAIWLSRYCLDSEKTLAEVNAVIEAKQADLQATREETLITPQTTQQSGAFHARESINHTNENTQLSRHNLNYQVQKRAVRRQLKRSKNSKKYMHASFLHILKPLILCGLIFSSFLIFSSVVIIIIQGEVNHKSLQMLPYLFPSFIISIIIIAGYWKFYEKAGIPGWALFIPIYNMYAIVLISGRPSWWLFLLVIPPLNNIVYFFVNIGIASRFNKGFIYVLGLTFLPFIFYPILGFSKARFSENDWVA